MLLSPISSISSLPSLASEMWVGHTSLWDKDEEALGYRETSLSFPMFIRTNNSQGGPRKKGLWHSSRGGGEGDIGEVWAVIYTLTPRAYSTHP